MDPPLPGVWEALRPLHGLSTRDLPRLVHQRAAAVGLPCLAPAGTWSCSAVDDGSARLRSPSYAGPIAGPFLSAPSERPTQRAAVDDARPAAGPRTPLGASAGGQVLFYVYFGLGLTLSLKLYYPFFLIIIIRRTARDGQSELLLRRGPV